MTIKAGEVAFLKTTGETVFVLEYPSSQASVQGDVKVRRPVAGRDGITHFTDIFFYNELETQDEQRKRFLSEREEILAKYANGQTPSIADLGLSSN